MKTMNEKKNRFPDCNHGEFPAWHASPTPEKIKVAIFAPLDSDREIYVWTPTGYKGVPDSVRYGDKLCDCLDSYTAGDGERFFVFTPGGCFQPPTYLICADSFEDAYATFCCDFEALVAVDEIDAGDYPEEYRQYNDSGSHIDTESTHGWEVKLLSLEFNS